MKASQKSQPLLRGPAARQTLYKFWGNYKKTITRPEMCKPSESLTQYTISPYTISGKMTSEERGREKGKEGKRGKRRW